MMGVLKTFAAEMTQPLVWTLIHSLWQGLLIVAVLTLILRLIPARLSSVRYSLAAGALAVMFVASLSTYFYLMPESSPVARETSAIRFTPHQPIDPASADLPGLLNNVIDSNITIISLVWLSGVLFYLVRMASGFFFIASVRKNAVELDGEWNALLRRLSDNLELKRIVKLAESSQIDVPFVTG